MSSSKSPLKNVPPPQGGAKPSVYARFIPREELGGYHLLPAARADLLRRLGRRAEAAVAYASALSLVRSRAERLYLERRLDECGR